MAKRDHGGHDEGGGGHGGGSLRWLVSYADFITLLMVFFIIMYSMGRTDLKKMAALAGSLRMAFLPSGSLAPGTGGGVLIAPGGPGGNDVGSPGGDGDGGGAGKVDGLSGPGLATATMVPIEIVAQDVADALGEMVKSGEVRIVNSERGLAIQMQGTVLFDLGKAELRRGAETVLHEVAEALKRVQNIVAIEGYTDNLPIKTAEFPSNWELSTRRGTTVLRHFVEREGLPPERFIAIGYGEHRPLFDNRTEQGRAQNRRVDIVLLKTAPLLNVGREVKPQR